uniref:(northern house mosquito) hypothetical protein n=1 Tax=Culex pipiens TaxID=7175 RepID=A0A8D8EWZ0_CULPI
MVTSRLPYNGRRLAAGFHRGPDHTGQRDRVLVGFLLVRGFRVELDGPLEEAFEAIPRDHRVTKGTSHFFHLLLVHLPHDWSDHPRIRSIALGTRQMRFRIGVVLTSGGRPRPC